MCGFVAVISPALPVREDLLIEMRDRLIHRGPDNGSNWFRANRRLALAHRRLAIIDTSHIADQPMSSADGLSQLVFNGEIYNYLELRAELEALGSVFRTASDTEVLLEALLLWGDAALPRLNGMFAFAFWREQTRTLLVARDRFGEKPLFIGRGRLDTVVVASEMKAIFPHPLMPCSANEKAIEDYSANNWYEDGRSTFFEGIERLPPAHAAVIQEDGTEVRRWRYWTPDYSRIDHQLKPREAVEQFTSLLERSIKLRLRADVPIGSSLSGGLDSSVIVGCLARNRSLAGFAQNTFSACFPADPTISEDREIGAVVAHTGVNSFTVVPDPVALTAESRALHWHQEEPFLSASIYLQWCVARLAAEQGTTVLLDGQGADELLAGYQPYFRLRQLDLLDQQQSELATRETAKFNRRLRLASGRYEGADRRFNAEVAYSEQQLQEFRTRRPAVTQYPYGEGTAPALPGFRLRRTLSEALQYNCLPMLLRYADRNAMAFSREGRLPYLDYDLVDFCISLPDHYFVRNGWQKWILRQAAGARIPREIRWRADKVGYAAPLDRWLRGDIKAWAAERLNDSRLRGVPGYDHEYNQSLWTEHQAGRANNSWALWRWISLVEWIDLADAGWWRAGRVRW